MRRGPPRFPIPTVVTSTAATTATVATAAPAIATDVFAATVTATATATATSASFPALVSPLPPRLVETDENVFVLGPTLMSPVSTDLVKDAAYVCSTAHVDVVMFVRIVTLEADVDAHVEPGHVVRASHLL